jgi:hypothetical protein
MDVTWEELARHAEGRPLEPARRAAVEHFLGKHFADSDTSFDLATDEDTVEFRPES